ncbi:thioesterase family protein [Maritimibacter sp. UBA3975]|uniref:acyl-CoA thioesterase n=1 Tax=Maritimibacter sp. UBA3975 TaxID=1946833 RepID=UPI000C09D653|nr:thioesterase family protein [Maritimibacter sp. UBA3975]MAM60355.1 thioesterase [Maritimibacter sp.]|tara:strand:+ start:4488 stop:4967 length:480 start_codon:yes stop_codon:yes gene_type:complete
MTLSHLTPLTRADLAAQGIPEPWAFGRADKVRFGELDPLNHVNNATYPGWMETARVGYFDHIGFDRSGDIRLVLISTSLRYLRPIHLGDSYIVCVRATSFRTTSFTTEYAIYVDGQLATTGEAAMVCLGPDVATKRPLPDDARAAFLRDGAVDLRDTPV